MFPDYPRMRERFGRVLTLYLRRSVRDKMPWSEGVSRSIIHEGRTTIIVRPNGEEDPTEIVEARSEQIFTEEELASMDVKRMLEKLETLASEMARQQSMHFFETMDEVTSKTGNVVKSKGKSLNAEALLDVLELMAVDFESDGSISAINVVASPGQQQAIEEEFHNSPELQKRYQKIMQKKKVQFGAREASRILVG